MNVLRCKNCKKLLLDGVDPTPEEKKQGYILIRCCGLLHKIDIEKEKEEPLYIVDNDDQRLN